MTEHTTLDSFIVRIYRVDTEDRRKIVGLVETTDGSDRREPFADIDELCVILNCLCKPARKRLKGMNTPKFNGEEGKRIEEIGKRIEEIGKSYRGNRKEYRGKAEDKRLRS